MNYTRSNSTKPPQLLISLEVSFHSDLPTEIEMLIESCKGERVDRFGHVKYWKCMLALIHYILSMVEIKRGDVKTLTEQIGFSEDQIVRSLDRFAEKKILIKDSSRFNSTWTLNQEKLPVVYFLCRTKKLEHIMRRTLTLNE